jgi:ribonucleases P/MRP protein subunit RPP40
LKFPHIKSLHSNVDTYDSDTEDVSDKVSHRLLLRKLARLGFSGSFLAWIGSYLAGREQFVKASGSQSRRISVRSGVSQGSHLGLLLFMLFINDFFHVSSYFALFCTLMISKYFFLLSATVTSQIPSGVSTCRDSGVQLNLEKCKSMSSARSHFKRHFQYELSGHKLDSMDYICDLGVVLDTKLNFTSHIDSLIVKASRMLGYIRRIGREFRDPHTLRTLYNSFVRSHLDYARVVWNSYYGVHLKRNEALQKKIRVTYAGMEPRYTTTSLLSKVPFD